MQKEALGIVQKSLKRTVNKKLFSRKRYAPNKIKEDVEAIIRWSSSYQFSTHNGNLFWDIVDHRQEKSCIKRLHTKDVGFRTFQVVDKGVWAKIWYMWTKKLLILLCLKFIPKESKLLHGTKKLLILIWTKLHVNISY